MSEYEVQNIMVLDKRTGDALSLGEVDALERVLRGYYDTQFFEFEAGRSYRSDRFSMFRVNLARRLICKYKPSNTLVVGSGLGVLEEEAKSATSVVSVDVSTRTLLHQRSHGASWPLVAASACALPIQDDAFDMVVCLEVLEHLVRPFVALHEIQRVCKRHLVVSFPTHETWSYCALGIYGNPYKDITYQKALDERVGHISVAACSDVPGLLSQTGWVARRKWGQNSLLPPEYQFRFGSRIVRRIGRAVDVINNIDYAIAGWPWLRDHGIGTIYLFARQP